MDLNAVYKKTQKGLEEMAQRTVLGMRERTLLVMVDGKTSAADLLARAQHMPDPPALLGKLIDGGFIAPDAAASAPAAAAAAAGTAAAATAASPSDQILVQQLKHYAEHFLDQVLGPDADMLSEAVDRCKTLPELRVRMEKTRDAIEGMGKRRKAEEFWTHVQALLDGKPPPVAAPAQPAAAPPPPPPPAAPAAVPAAPPPAATPAAPPAPSAQEAIRFARRYISDALGPDGDMLVEAIERCKTLAELRSTMEKTRDALLNGVGKRRAEEFWQGVQPRLPPE
ncbi:MAG: hypothetical protein IT512_09490 [Rhodocyclaceae bacterium]|nr:hypothetical protein [Rhodocyclaceae bacterium]